MSYTTSSSRFAVKCEGRTESWENDGSHVPRLPVRVTYIIDNKAKRVFTFSPSSGELVDLCSSKAAECSVEISGEEIRVRSEATKPAEVARQLYIGRYDGVFEDWQNVGSSSSPIVTDTEGFCEARPVPAGPDKPLF